MNGVAWQRRDTQKCPPPGHRAEAGTPPKENCGPRCFRFPGDIYSPHSQQTSPMSTPTQVQPGSSAEAEPQERVHRRGAVDLTGASRRSLWLGIRSAPQIFTDALLWGRLEGQTRNTWPESRAKGRGGEGPWAGTHLGAPWAGKTGHPSGVRFPTRG